MIEDDFSWDAEEEYPRQETDEEVNEIPMGPLDPFSDFPEYWSDYYVDCD